LNGAIPNDDILPARKVPYKLSSYIEGEAMREYDFLTALVPGVSFQIRNTFINDNSMK
jgi:hypothetical protein